MNRQTDNLPVLYLKSVSDVKLLNRELRFNNWLTVATWWYLFPHVTLGATTCGSRDSDSLHSPLEHIIQEEKKRPKCHSCPTGKSWADNTDMPRHCIRVCRPLKKDSPNVVSFPKWIFLYGSKQVYPGWTCQLCYTQLKTRSQDDRPWRNDHYVLVVALEVISSVVHYAGRVGECEAGPKRKGLNHLVVRTG